MRPSNRTEVRIQLAPPSRRVRTIAISCSVFVVREKSSWVQQTPRPLASAICFRIPHWPPSSAMDCLLRLQLCANLSVLVRIAMYVDVKIASFEGGVTGHRLTWRQQERQTRSRIASRPEWQPGRFCPLLLHEYARPRSIFRVFLTMLLAFVPQPAVTRCFYNQGFFNTWV